jgi:hypothetical protein
VYRLLSQVGIKLKDKQALYVYCSLKIEIEMKILVPQLLYKGVGVHIFYDLLQRYVYTLVRQGVNILTGIPGR